MIVGGRGETRERTRVCELTPSGILTAFCTTENALLGSDGTIYEVCLSVYECTNVCVCVCVSYVMIMI